MEMNGSALKLGQAMGKVNLFSLFVSNRADTRGTFSVIGPGTVNKPDCGSIEIVVAALTFKLDLKNQLKFHSLYVQIMLINNIHLLELFEFNHQ